ncbi:MAG TPA: DUF554 domain-containing protein [Clostridia bacterium]|nr:DUF554 domain-containing protein [Clostridia bacterium]
MGLLLKKGLPAQVGETIIGGLALCVFYIGISGSLLIIGIALNMFKVTNLKIMNYVPAIFFIIIFCLF